MMCHRAINRRNKLSDNSFGNVIGILGIGSGTKDSNRRLLFFGNLKSPHWNKMWDFIRMEILVIYVPLGISTFTGIYLKFENQMKFEN